MQRGLGDRAEAVCVAAAMLLGSWVDACEEEGGVGGRERVGYIARYAEELFVTRKAVSETELDGA